MPSWNDFGGMWSTLREIDVSAIRDEAEQPLYIALVGHVEATEAGAALLRAQAERFPAVGLDPLGSYPLPLSQATDGELQRADLLLLAFDLRRPTLASDLAAAERLTRLSVPLLVVLTHSAPDGAPNVMSSPKLASLYNVQLPDPQDVRAATILATAVLERLPSGLHLTAARRLPGLRNVVAQSLVNQTSFTNATYSLASGLPQQIPVLSIPFAAADILVLTKNQGLLVYKLALALGAPPDFQSRIKEVLPVIGGAYLWRGLARTLVGLIPVWGLVPKIAVAYAGTYVTGIAAWRWYAKGELVSRRQLQRLSVEALQIGRERASELIAQARRGAGEARSSATEQAGGLWARIRRRLPGAGNEATLSDPPQLMPGESSDPPA